MTILEPLYLKIKAMEPQMGDIKIMSESLLNVVAALGGKRSGESFGTPLFLP